MSLTNTIPARPCGCPDATPHAESALRLARRIAAAPLSLYRRWRQRRIDRLAFQRMLTLDESMLKDIGVTRGDVVWAANLPLRCNAAHELQKVARFGHAA